MNKQALYYVLKYEGQYYCPYLDAGFTADVYSDINKMLTPHRYLAVRFPTKEVAQAAADSDTQIRTTASYFSPHEPHDKNFDPTKVRVVAVYRKTPTVH